jgi:hypothetical protein
LIGWNLIFVPSCNEWCRIPSNFTVLFPVLQHTSNSHTGFSNFSPIGNSGGCDINIRIGLAQLDIHMNKFLATLLLQVAWKLSSVTSGRDWCIQFSGVSAGHEMILIWQRSEVMRCEGIPKVKSFYCRLHGWNELESSSDFMIDVLPWNIRDSHPH